jgi:hypothetical protein
MDDQLYIVTLAEMKAELKLDDAEEDANLTLWMNGMQGRFDARLNRRLLKQDRIEILDGGMMRVYVHNYPIVSVESIHLDPAGQFDSATLLDDADGYRALDERGEILCGLYGSEPWPMGYGNIRVAYTGGYYACDAEEVPDGYTMPDDIRLAFMMQMGSLWANRGNLGITSKGKDGSTVQYGAGVMLTLNNMTLLPDVEMILDKYTRYN